MTRSRRHLTLLLVVACLAALNLLPLGYMLALSMRPSGDSVWPGIVWLELWSSAPLFCRWLANSFIVATVSVLFHLLADSMAGWVLARARFRGQTTVFAIIVLALMVPRQVTLIPLFLGFARAGLADTLLGVLLPGLGDVIGIFLMRQFFLTVPESLIEAARIDGASEWQIFRQIALPLARPALAVLGVLGFQHYWSDFFWPLVITQSAPVMTAQVGLTYLVQSEFGLNLPLMAAGSSAAALPVILLFLATRNLLFQGMRAGGVK